MAERAIITAAQERTMVLEDGSEQQVVDLDVSVSLDVSSGRGGAVRVGRYSDRDVYDLLVSDEMVGKVKTLSPPAYLGPGYDSIPQAAQDAIKQITWYTGGVDRNGNPKTRTGTVAEWKAAGRPEVKRGPRNPNAFQGAG